MKLSEEGAERVLERLDFKRRLSGMDLVVAVAREWSSGEVLMQAYMNREAALKTLTTGKATYWSTSRRRLWIKGEESGNAQSLRGFSVDCDGDSVLLDVEQSGPACHRGLRSCYDTHRVVDEEEIRAQLIQLIKRDALAFGEFTLTSGRKSNYYLDIKRITTRPSGLSLVSHLMARRYTKGVDCVAGPELGAVPVTVAVAMRSGLPYAMIRRQDRSHGTMRRIEGDIGQGAAVLVIDDVATSGGSLVGCVEAIRNAGAEVSRITCVVDRKEGAAELLRSKCGVELEPLVTADDLGLRP